MTDNREQELDAELAALFGGATMSSEAEAKLRAALVDADVGTLATKYQADMARIQELADSIENE